MASETVIRPIYRLVPIDPHGLKLGNGNTRDKLASLKPAKTVTPAFSFDFTKCGQVWTLNVVYLRAVKVSLTKGKIHTYCAKRSFNNKTKAT